MTVVDQATLAVIQRYIIESYGQPGSNMSQRAYYQFTRTQIAACFSQWAKDKSIDTLIDIGSSTGFLTRQLQPFAKRTIAVDANRHVLAAINDPTIETVQDYLPDLEQLPAQLAAVVTCTDTLYYLSDAQLERALTRIAEILTPGGYLIFNDNGNVDRLAQKLASQYRQVAALESPFTVKPKPDFDRCYWWLESRYLLCRGVFRALADPAFDVKRQTSEIQHWPLIRYCLRYPWLRYALPLLFPLRFLSRCIWASTWLFERFCVIAKPSPCLWVYQKI
ncbi:class I SAM-dependent methyltransferase [Parvibium lacunae]|uniref:Class I SAM-dependent methyltransferase n=1 Tax=Parvibium lacunae TaxID=1888893 RepID=A0A368L0B3_9BURK|nr:class I SAM-dependent methyltransferase [Parvibium lacunae]RCS57008.1 class I SAM-dependent methyltransferase [Parvibium lacunae]